MAISYEALKELLGDDEAMIREVVELYIHDSNEYIAQIEAGGELEFVMGPKPSAWGAGWHPQPIKIAD